MEKFGEYSLSIDLDKDGSLVYSIWNQFTNLSEMMNRIFRLIELFHNNFHQVRINHFLSC